MVNSIGGSGMAGMCRPDPKEFFSKVDSDGSGGISQAELKTLSENLEKISGKPLDASDEAFSIYDSDGDGSLSADELKSVLDNSGFGPPSAGEGMAPPPPPQDQVSSSYGANSGNDTVAELVKTLQSLIDQLSSENTTTTNGESTAGANRPDPNEFFNKVDMDGSGGISQSELKSLSDDMKSRTGSGIDTSDEVFAKYDVGGDGVLSQDELKKVMDDNRPKMAHGDGGPPPPPPGRMEQSSSTASSSSGSLEDQIAILRNLIDKLSNIGSSNSDNSDGGSSILSVTT
jgi:Ca2+-binding EF-hand superfamily protein